MKDCLKLLQIPDTRSHQYILSCEVLADFFLDLPLDFGFTASMVRCNNHDNAGTITTPTPLRFSRSAAALRLLSHCVRENHMTNVVIGLDSY